MSGRFLTQRDMSVAKHEMEVFNSHLNRGEVENADKIKDTRHIVCGCGAIGCIFIHVNRNGLPQA